MFAMSEDNQNLNETSNDISAPEVKLESTANSNPETSPDNSINKIDWNLSLMQTFASSSSSKKKNDFGRGNLAKEAVDRLKNWLFEHFTHPYPTDADKEHLAKESSLTITQVNNWFINARRRIWKPEIEKQKGFVSIGGKLIPTSMIGSAKISGLIDQGSVSLLNNQATNEKKNEGPTNGALSTSGTNIGTSPKTEQTNITTTTTTTIEQKSATTSPKIFGMLNIRTKEMSANVINPDLLILQPPKKRRRSSSSSKKTRSKHSSEKKIKEEVFVCASKYNFESMEKNEANLTILANENWELRRENSYLRERFQQDLKEKQEEHAQLIAKNDELREQIDRLEKGIDYLSASNINFEELLKLKSKNQNLVTVDNLLDQNEV